MLRTFTAILIAAITVPVSAQAPAPSQQAAATSKSKDPNRIICEREDQLGSRLGGKKVCMTWQQWQEKRAEQRDTLEDVQRKNTSVGSPTG
jgi:hypothetical protein